MSVIVRLSYNETQQKLDLHKSPAQAGHFSYFLCRC